MRPLIVLRLHRERGSGETAPPARSLRTGGGVQRAGSACGLVALPGGLPRSQARAALNPPGTRSLSVADPQPRGCRCTRAHILRQSSPSGCLPRPPSLGPRAGLEPFPAFHNRPPQAAGVAGTTRAGGLRGTGSRRRRLSFQQQMSLQRVLETALRPPSVPTAAPAKCTAVLGEGRRGSVTKAAAGSGEPCPPAGAVAAGACLRCVR